jgi:phosphatidylglycerol---prolipoprotein diacylglyceryl transferase
MLAYIDYPSWLKPEVFGFLNLPANHILNIFRWYGLAYIIGIIIAYFMVMYLLKNDKEQYKTLNKKIIDDLFFWGILGLILGGRIFSCLVYDFPHYSKYPLEILIPFRDGQFVGFQGMAYHGAVIGVFLVCVIYVILKKLDPRELADLFFPAVPLAYTLGRLANFANAELYGRITSHPIGMLFPYADRMPITLPEVQKVITELGWKINEATLTVVDKAGNLINNGLGKMIIAGQEHTVINLPRHPSQLYEAFFEGIVLFLIIWFPARKFKPFKGFLASVYLCGYAIARICIEYFRQPDSQFANYESGKYIGYIVGNLTMGQILSWGMLLFGIGLGVFFYFYPKMFGTTTPDLNKKTNIHKKKK